MPFIHHRDERHLFIVVMNAIHSSSLWTPLFIVVMNAIHSSSWWTPFIYCRGERRSFIVTMNAICSSSRWKSVIHLNDGNRLFIVRVLRGAYQILGRFLCGPFISSWWSYSSFNYVLALGSHTTTRLWRNGRNCTTGSTHFIFQFVWGCIRVTIWFVRDSQTLWGVTSYFNQLHEFSHFLAILKTPLK